MELRVKKIKIEGDKFTLKSGDNTVIVEKSQFGPWLDIEFEEEIEQVMQHYTSSEIGEFVNKWKIIEQISDNELLSYIERDEKLMKGLEDILLRRKRFLKLERINNIYKV